MKKYVTAGLVTVALALGASACGGDDSIAASTMQLTMASS
ncbi:MAG: hypothetical protein RL413_1579, partial [Actinomycetota bacterium]